MSNEADKTSNEDTLPQVQDAESEPGWAIEPTGAPEEFGLTPDATIEKKRVWDRQEVFLAAYRETGRIATAARQAGMTRWAVIHWQRGDVFDFRNRLEAAHHDWCEDKIEGLIDSRLESPEGNRGSDILLMFKAKAEMPSKYREEVKIIDTSATKDLLAELRRLGQAKVVEGHVLEHSEGSLVPPTESPTVEPEAT